MIVLGNNNSGDTLGSGVDLAALCDGLQSLRSDIGDSKLSARTQKLLMINDRADAQVLEILAQVNLVSPK